MKRYKPIKKRSVKGKLRAECGKLHLELLRIQRDNYDTCEICGKSTNHLGRFHIVSIAQCLKAEFIDENIILTGWFCCHFPWHHSGMDDPKCAFILKRIIELRGEDYKEKIKIKARFVGTLNEFYYKNLKVYFANKLKGIL